MLIELIDGYSGAFSKFDGELGCYIEVTHYITTIDDNPVRVPCRRVPPQYWDELREYLMQWIEKGVLRECTSTYAGPIVIIRKKTGEILMYIDSMPKLVKMRIQYQELKKLSMSYVESRSSVA